MDKKTNKVLMEYAEEILQKGYPEGGFCPLFKNSITQIVYKSYNGQISALGVSILMIGLRPTLAVYIQDAPQDTNVSEAYRIYLLEVIARMLEKYRPEEYEKTLQETQPAVRFYDGIKCRKAYNLTRYVLGLSQTVAGVSEIEKKLKTDILNCSVALKEIIRTYALD